MSIEQQERRRPRPAIAFRVAIAVLVLTVLAIGGTVIVGPHAVAGYSNVTATTAVNIRSGPSTKYRIVGVLYAGERLKQAGNPANGWMPVTYRGHKAYISAKYLSTATSSSTSKASTAAGASFAATTTAALNLRSGPALSRTVVTVVPKATTLKVTGSPQGSYSPIEYQGKQLWAATAYLSRSAAPSQPLPTTGLSQGRATVALMARTTSDNSFVSLGDIPAGTILTLTGVQQNGVAQVIWQNALRWVNARYVAPVKPSSGVQTPELPKTTGTRYATVALDIRTTSGSDSVTLSEVPLGTELAITGVVSNGRAEIVWQGAVRWVTARFLSTSAPSAPAPNQGGVGLASLKPYASELVSVVFKRYPQITTIYGVRPDSLPDHPTGHAIDMMLPKGADDNALGWEMAEWLRANAAELNIQYVIFDQKIWNISRDDEGWREMADRGSPTANHKDHIHVTTVWD